MSQALVKIQELIRLGKYRVSDHGYNELANDGLLVSEIVAGIEAAAVVEDYPNYPKGPCVLVLEKGATGMAIHALWGITPGENGAGGIDNGLSAGSEQMERDLYEKTTMTTRKQTKLLHEDDYLAEVDVELIETDDSWAPYLSPQDAQKLDEVRVSLRKGDLKAAAKNARLYRLTPVHAA